MVRRGWGVGKWTNRSSPSNHETHYSCGPTEQSESRVVLVNQTS